MNYLEEDKKRAVKINLSSTENFLDKLFSGQSFKVVSEFPTINNLQCEIKRGERCFNYSAGDIFCHISPVKYQHKQYGYLDPFTLKNQEFNIDIPNGLHSAKIKFLDGAKTSGEITKIISRNRVKSSIRRAIFTLPKLSEIPMTFIESLPFRTETHFRARGYFSFTYEQYYFRVFNDEVANSSSLIIECSDKIEIDLFEKITTAFLHCFALISGNLIREEVFVIDFEDKDFKKVSGFSFKKLEGSYMGIATMNLNLFNQLSEHLNKKKRASKLTPEFFQSFLYQTIKDKRLLRAVKIINESSEYPFEIKASTYSVALETIKNIVIDDNQEKINPFKSKRTARKVIKNLQKVIRPIPNEEFNNKQMVLNKLEQINQVGNRDSFLLAFRLLNIDLNEDDIRCINMRNDFLHGRIPFEEEDIDSNYKLRHIVLKLHLLVTAMILKKCNYSGIVLNNIKLQDLLVFEKNIKEPLSRII